MFLSPWCDSLNSFLSPSPLFSLSLSLVFVCTDFSGVHSLACQPGEPEGLTRAGGPLGRRVGLSRELRLDEGEDEEEEEESRQDYLSPLRRPKQPLRGDPQGLEGSPHQRAKQH